MEFVYSPNNSSRKSKEIICIVLHFTRGGDADGTVKWLTNPDAKASAHYVVSRSGKVTQLVKEERAAWHAGSSITKPSLNGVTGLNSRSIGIEICNWGPLFKAKVDEDVALANGGTAKRVEGATYCAARRWTYKYRGPTPEIRHVNTDVIKNDKHWPGAGHIYLWEPYPKAQIEAILELLKDIVSRYPHITKEWVTRHQDIDPTRKIDTGPAFPLDYIFDCLFPHKTEDGVFQVGRRTEDAMSSDEMSDMGDDRSDKPKKKFCLW